MSKFDKVFEAIKNLNCTSDNNGRYLSINRIFYLFNEPDEETSWIPDYCWDAMRTLQWAGFETPGTKPYDAPRWATKWEKRNFR